MSTVFVPCATGNIGKALIPTLLKDGHKVVAGAHTKAQAEKLLQYDIPVHCVEFEDRETLVNAMKGCDSLFLVLPLVERIKAFGHQMIEASKEVGIEYIVRSSAYGASSDAHWKLGREHGVVDQFTEDSGIDYTILRSNCLMQTFSATLASSITEQQKISLPEADAKVSYIDAHDIAACASALFTDHSDHLERTYALTGPQAHTLNEVAAFIEKASGKTISYDPISEDAYVAQLLEQGMPKWNTTMAISISRVTKLGLPANVTQAVEYITNTAPRTFEEFVEANKDSWA